ncbi:MAG: DUF2279 domain-containing protein [Bacteroidales bacterium]|jgi:hypothetical protein|nr:DUF2279 domain-containing protein [Bacteroidales bacterium]
MKKATILLIILCLGLQTLGQEDTLSVNRKRLNLLIIGGSAIYAGSMIGLYQAWYRDYPHSSFHFTNDGSEWEGLDKLGHVTTSYWVGRISYHSLRWAGVKDKHAIWYGGSMGLLFLTTVEIMDGFSEEWGASLSDLAANAAGAGLFIGQQLLWKEQRFLIKFSYHPTDFPQYRPDVLGSTCIEKVLKDYNGHTYWLSGNIHAFLREGSRFPRWFNVAIGYGATGMTGGSENVNSYEGEPIPEFTRTRQYFLSLDVDLTRIRTRSKFLKGVFTLLGFIKIPMPTLEYTSEGSLVFHYLYF